MMSSVTKHARLAAERGDARYQELQDELEHRLLVLVDQLRVRIATVAAELGLIPQQALACDPSNVAGLVDRMAARGLVCRVADASDQRVKHVVLTNQGWTQRAALQARLFAHSPAIDTLAPHERRQLLLLLRKLTPEISEMDAM